MNSDAGVAQAVRRWVGESTKAIVGAVVGGAIGYAIALYGRFQADAAVSVRPGLADVGFIQAMVTNHGGDWLYYHYPMVMTAVTVLLVGLFGFAAGVKA